MKKIVPRNDIFACTISNPFNDETEDENLIHIKFKISRIYWEGKMNKIIDKREEGERASITNTFDCIPYI